MCGTVWYTVTISTEGGILIITDNTTMTNYNVTGGLNDNTVYHVNVTASNNAGSNGGTTTRIRTNSNGKLNVVYLHVYLSTVCNCRYSIDMHVKATYSMNITTYVRYRLIITSFLHASPRVMPRVFRVESAKI